MIAGTSPDLADTDDDGTGGGADVEAGTDPRDGLAGEAGIVSPVAGLGVAIDVCGSSALLGVAGPAFAGQVARFVANVDDDVLVREVEFRVDGAKVAADGGAPFEHRFRVGDTATRLRVRARAADSGGNVAWSEEIDVPVVGDSDGPTVVQLTPPPGTIASSLPRLILRFDEPLDATTISNATVGLFSAGADGLLGSLDDVPVAGAAEWHPAILAVFWTPAASLPAGLHRASARGALADVAGNAVAPEYSAPLRLLAQAAATMPIARPATARSPRAPRPMEAPRCSCSRAARAEAARTATPARVAEVRAERSSSRRRRESMSWAACTPEVVPASPMLVPAAAAPSASSRLASRGTGPST